MTNHKKNLKLLLIIDDWEKGELIENKLKPFLEVEHAPFGLTGIEMLMSNHYNFAFVCLELNDMSEQEFYSKLLECLMIHNVPAHDFFEKTKICYSNQLALKGIRKSLEFVEFLLGDFILKSPSYLNEKGYQVLTAHFLKERGYCCNNGCRHCPYKK